MDRESCSHTDNAGGNNCLFMAYISCDSNPETEQSLTVFSLCAAGLVLTFCLAISQGPEPGHHGHGAREVRLALPVGKVEGRLHI